MSPEHRLQTGTIECALPNHPALWQRLSAAGMSSLLEFQLSLFTFSQAAAHPMRPKSPFARWERPGFPNGLVVALLAAKDDIAQEEAEGETNQKFGLNSAEGRRTVSGRDVWSGWVFAQGGHFQKRILEALGSFRRRPG